MVDLSDAINNMDQLLQCLFFSLAAAFMSGFLGLCSLKASEKS